MKYLFTLLFICAAVVSWGQGAFSVQGMIEKREADVYYYYPFEANTIQPSMRIYFKGEALKLAEKASYPRFFLGRHYKPVVWVSLNVFSVDKGAVTVSEMMVNYPYRDGDWVRPPNSEIITTAEKDSVFEGYLYRYTDKVNHKEKYRFTIFKGDKVYSLNVAAKPETEMINDTFNQSEVHNALERGMYVKVRATYSYADTEGYGFFSLGGNSIAIEEILQKNIYNTANMRLATMLEKGYSAGNDILYPPQDFVLGKKYTYISGEDSGIEVTIKKVSPVMLRFTYRQKNKTTNIRYSTELLIDAESYLLSVFYPGYAPYSYTSGKDAMFGESIRLTIQPKAGNGTGNPPEISLGNDNDDSLILSLKPKL